MRRSLLPVPPLVARSGFGIITVVAPADITLVTGDVGQHRIVVVTAPTGPADPAIARLGHAFQSAPAVL